MENSALSSNVYGEIGNYVTAYCRGMLSNLENDPRPDKDYEDPAVPEDENATTNPRQ